MKIKRGMCQISNCRICYKMLQHQPCGKSMKKKDNTAIKIRTVYILRQTDKPQSSGPEPIGHQSSKLEDVLKVYMHLIPYISQPEQKQFSHVTKQSCAPHLLQFESHCSRANEEMFTLNYHMIPVKKKPNCVAKTYSQGYKHC